MHCPSSKSRAFSARQAYVTNAARRIPRLLSAKDIRATLEISNPITCKSKYAYFTLVSTSDSVPGALLLGWSLKQTNTTYDCVAMVVPDVSRRERSLLRRIYDRVVEVDTVKPPRTTQKMRYLTAEERTTLSRRMTKYNIFRFIEYQKVLFIESSTYILRNIDEIFQLEAPAGISSLVDSRSQSRYHGIKLSKEHIAKSLQLSHGIRGHMLMLVPDLSMYHLSHSTRCRYKETHFIQPDVEFITNLFRAQWTHIHSKFASIPWQANTAKKAAYGVCLENFQPWKDDCPDFDEICRWRQKAINMCNDIPQVRAVFRRKRWFSVLQEESRLLEKL